MAGAQASKLTNVHLLCQLTMERKGCRLALTPSTAGKNLWRGDFSGGAVVKNPPTNAGDTGSSPGPGRSPMPQIN